MLGESMTSGSGSGSMVHVGRGRDKRDDSKDDVKRGWDWRKGLEKDAKGEDVLRILRLGLAKDIAKHWVTSAGA